MTQAILPDFIQCEGIEPTMIVSRDLAKASAFASEYGVARSGMLEQALSASDIDAVYIATPHPFHFEIAMAAIQAGKHVLVEKPITMNFPQAKALVEAALQKSVFLMEAMWQAFNPTVVEMHRLLASDAIGEVRYMEASFGVAVPMDHGHRLWNRELGGGSVLDQGVYPISLIQSVLGRPQNVGATGAVCETGVDSEAVIRLSFKSGATAIAASSLTAYLPNQAVISGTTGRIEIHGPIYNPVGLTLSKWSSVSPWSPPQTESYSHVQVGNGYVPMLQAVAQSISAGELENPRRSHSDSLFSMLTIDRALAEIHI